MDTKKKTIQYESIQEETYNEGSLLQSSTPLNITIFTTSEDIASMNIRDQLLKNYPFKKKNISELDFKWNTEVFSEIHQYTLKNVIFTMVLTSERSIYLDKILNPDELHGDLIIFASRHSAKSGLQALLVHTPGNWDNDISAGGSPKSIAKGSGIALFYLHKLLYKFSTEEGLPYPVGQEVTHHGPTHFNAPICFIELGSNYEQWVDVLAARIIAKTIIEAGKIISKYHWSNNRIITNGVNICAGFGGTHYMPNFETPILNGYSMVHTVPKYKILALDFNMINQIRYRSLEEIKYWVVDWKGINSIEKQHLIPLLEATNIPILKTKELKRKKLSSYIEEIIHS